MQGDARPPGRANGHAVRPAVIARQRRPQPARAAALGVGEADQRIGELIDQVGRAVGSHGQIYAGRLRQRAGWLLVHHFYPPRIRPARGVEDGPVLHVVVGRPPRQPAA